MWRSLLRPRPAGRSSTFGMLRSVRPTWRTFTPGWLTVTTGLSFEMSSHFGSPTFFSGARGLAKSMVIRTSSGFWTGLPARVALTAKSPEGEGSRCHLRR